MKNLWCVASTTHPTINKLWVMNTVLNVCRDKLDIPVHKVKYALTTGLLNGAFKCLENYGFELNTNTFDIFYEAVSTKLSGNSDVEYEWTETEYDAIMQIRSLYCD